MKTTDMSIIWKAVEQGHVEESESMYDCFLVVRECKQGLDTDFKLDYLPCHIDGGISLKAKCRVILIAS